MSEDFDNTEQFLLAQVAGGDQAAFTRLYNRYVNKLYDYVLRISKSPAEAEDCVQQVFTNIWANRAALTRVSNFNSYLFTSSRNQYLNLLKKTARIELGTDLGQESLSMNRTPHDELEGKDLKAFLHDARNSLPLQQKKAFALSRDESLSIAEISALLNLSESTTKEHISKALNTLRKKYLKYSNLQIFIVLGLSLVFSK